MKGRQIMSWLDAFLEGASYAFNPYATIDLHRVPRIPRIPRIGTPADDAAKLHQDWRRVSQDGQRVHDDLRRALERVLRESGAG